jgi:hypothetical protein
MESVMLSGMEFLKQEMTEEDLTKKAHEMYERLLCWSDVFTAMELDVAKKSVRSKLPTGLIVASIIDEYYLGR